MKNIVILLLTSLVFLTECQRIKLTKTHGIAYLDKREKLIIVSKSNKNDAIKVLGQPATKGMTDDNLWIYIERTITKGKTLKLGRSELTKNNVLVLEFDKYGWRESDKIIFDELCPWYKGGPMDSPPFWSKFDGDVWHRYSELR